MPAGCAERGPVVWLLYQLWMDRQGVKRVQCRPRSLYNIPTVLGVRPLYLNTVFGHFVTGVLGDENLAWSFTWRYQAVWAFALWLVNIFSPVRIIESEMGLYGINSHWINDIYSMDVIPFSVDGFQIWLWVQAYYFNMSLVQISIINEHLKRSQAQHKRWMCWFDISGSGYDVEQLLGSIFSLIGLGASSFAKSSQYQVCSTIGSVERIFKSKINTRIFTIDLKLNVPSGNDHPYILSWLPWSNSSVAQDCWMFWRMLTVQFHS